jgi:hypothetical protein
MPRSTATWGDQVAGMEEWWRGIKHIVDMVILAEDSEGRGRSMTFLPSIDDEFDPDFVPF